MLHHRHLPALNTAPAPQEHPLGDVRAQHSGHYRIGAPYRSRLRGEQAFGCTWRAVP
jgi:hypothetical protein